jgi:hypothetical protein
MPGESIRIGVVLRKHGYSGVVTVFDGSMQVWSETTPRIRSTMGEALKDAQVRKAVLAE